MKKDIENREDLLQLLTLFYNKLKKYRIVAPRLDSET